jgi:hypothetical protein
MKIQTLTAAAVRFFALYLLLSAINLAAELAVTFGLPVEFSGGGILYTYALQLVISLIIVWFLLARTEVVTGWILRGPAFGEEEAAFTTGDLSMLAFFIAGLVFLITGLESLSLHLSSWFFSWIFHPAVPRHGQEGERLARMSSSVVQVIAGVWLLLRSRKAGKAPGAADSCRPGRADHPRHSLVSYTRRRLRTYESRPPLKRVSICIGLLLAIFAVTLAGPQPVLANGSPAWLPPPATSAPLASLGPPIGNQCSNAARVNYYNDAAHTTLVGFCVHNCCELWTCTGQMTIYDRTVYNVTCA